MLYTYYVKPKVRYVDMAIWIDENAYLPNCDDNKLFEYLYHLVYMLAVKNRYFNSYDLYDSFAIYVATTAYFRLKNKKQFELDENNEPKQVRIKSILNYLKQILAFRKISFQQTEYAQCLTPKEKEIPYSNFNYILQQSCDDLRYVEFDVYLDDIAKTIKWVIKDIPYKKDIVVWNNIYLSCLLTYLDQITVSTKNFYRLENSKKDEQYDDKILFRVYKEQAEQEPILFHLDNTFSDYIKILVKEIKDEISLDLTSILYEDIYNSDRFRNTEIECLQGEDDGNKKTYKKS